MPPTSSPPPFADEVWRTVRLATPLVLGHVAMALIALVDTVLAGRHGTLTLASVTIGTALWWLPNMLVLGTLLAVPPLVSQLDGAGRREDIASVFQQALWIALTLGLCLFVFQSLIVHALAPIGIAQEMIPGATDFLHAIRWGAPALTLTFCMRYLAEGLHWTVPTMLIGFLALAVLAPLGYALTFGIPGWLPERGAGGLGLASAIVLWLQAIAFALVLRWAPRFADLRLFARFQAPESGALRVLLATGLPIGVTWLMESSLFVFTALLVGRLGVIPAAAHQIAINVATLSFMVPLALAEATTVRVGHAIGAGQAGRVRRIALAGFVVMLVTQAGSASLMWLGNSAITALYTGDAAVAALAATLLLYAAAFQFPDGIQVLSAGALRGLKDTRIPMWMAICAYWGIGMPLGAWLGLGLGGVYPAMGPRGMWIGLIVGLSAAALLLGTRFLRASRAERLVTRIAVAHAGQ